MRRRVKVTGVGPVTPAGIGREAFFQGINRPVSRVRAISRFDPETGPFVGAEVSDFSLKDFAPNDNPKRMSRHTQLSLAAAILALKDAKISREELAGMNPLVVTGTSVMDFEKIARVIEIVHEKGPKYMPGSIMYEGSTANVAGKIVQWLDVPARMLTLQTSCCSGTDAIGHAFEQVASGQANIALAGGAESPLSHYLLMGFNAAELSPVTDETPEFLCRPFDLWRTTGVLGEGAAILILEPESSPRPALAWISGYGIANDAEGQTALGLTDAIKHALANASRRPDEVAFINAWGTGHRLIDANESRALQRVYGRCLSNIPVSSIKGSIGTALGASGPIQTASTVLSLYYGLLPPTVNWTTPDPECPLNLSGESRRIPIRIAVVDAHGMSGSNAALVLER